MSLLIKCSVPWWGSAQSRKPLSNIFWWNYECGFLRHLHCTHCAYWLMQAQRMQCGCRATHDCTCTWKNARSARLLASFNYWNLLSGVPAMFVTVWATVRAVYADTEWVRISHSSVIVTFTHFVHQWAWRAGESRGVEHSSSSVRGLLLGIDRQVLLFVFYVSIFQTFECVITQQQQKKPKRFSNTVPLVLAICGVRQWTDILCESPGLSWHPAEVLKD